MEPEERNRNELETIRIRSLEPDMYRTRFQQKLRAVRKQVQVPGFRRGKAPLTLLEKMVGKDVFRDLVKEWVEEEQQAFLNAIPEEKNQGTVILQPQVVPGGVVYVKPDSTPSQPGKDPSLQEEPWKHSVAIRLWMVRQNPIRADIVKPVWDAIPWKDLEKDIPADVTISDEELPEVARKERQIRMEFQVKSQDEVSEEDIHIIQIEVRVRRGETSGEEENWLPDQPLSRWVPRRFLAPDVWKELRSSPRLPMRFRLISEILAHVQEDRGYTRNTMARALLSADLLNRLGITEDHLPDLEIELRFTGQAGVIREGPPEPDEIRRWLLVENPVWYWFLYTGMISLNISQEELNERLILWWKNWKAHQMIWSLLDVWTRWAVAMALEHRLKRGVFPGLYQLAYTYGSRQDKIAELSRTDPNRVREYVILSYLEDALRDTETWLRNYVFTSDGSPLDQLSSRFSRMYLVFPDLYYLAVISGMSGALLLREFWDLQVAEQKTSMQKLLDSLKKQMDSVNVQATTAIIAILHAFLREPKFRDSEERNYIIRLNQQLHARLLIRGALQKGFLTSRPETISYREAEELLKAWEKKVEEAESSLSRPLLEVLQQAIQDKESIEKELVS